MAAPLKSYYAGFCVPAELPAAEIRAAILALQTAGTGKESAGYASNYLYQLLEAQYPCQQP